MKKYIFKKDNHMDILFTYDDVKNVGYDKIDYDSGCMIEISDDMVETIQSIMYLPNGFDILFPKKYYYIKDGKIIELKRQLDAKYFNVGEDIKNPSQYVLLNDFQTHYYLHHRDATIDEIWNL